jgi:hypothetical protein
VRSTEVPARKLGRPDRAPPAGRLAPGVPVVWTRLKESKSLPEESVDDRGRTVAPASALDFAVCPR